MEEPVVKIMASCPKSCLKEMTNVNRFLYFSSFLENISFGGEFKLSNGSFVGFDACAGL